MGADDKVTPLPTLLERLGRRIDQAWERTRKGEQEWIEGSLELAQALAEGRERFSADKVFGDWLVAERHDHVNKDDRAALINLAADLTLARDVLTKTTRRSYQHIWTEEQGRFLHVKKPDKPKRGRPKGSTSKTDSASVEKRKRSRRHKPRNATEQDAASKMLDEGKSRVAVVAETGLSEHVVQLSMERELGRREVLSSLLDAAAAKNFSEKGALRVTDALRINKVYLEKQFEPRVNEEVRRRIDAANDATRAENKRLRQEVHNLTQIVNQRGVFTEAQYRQMLMLCHPDSSASPELKAGLLQILVESKIRLVKPDK